MRRWVLLAACAAMVAGCGTEREGVGLPDPDGVPPIEAAAAIGDFSAVDPCSLIDPEAFGDHGAARFAAPTVIEDCRVLVTIDGANFEVRVGRFRYEDSLSDDEEMGTLPGGTRVVRSPSDEFGSMATVADSCNQNLIMADGIAVSASSFPQEPGGDGAEETACALAETAINGVHAALLRGEASRWDPPVGSMARVSACSVLDARTAAEELDLDAGEIGLRPGDTRCTWGTVSDQTEHVFLIVEIGDREFRSGTTEQEIGGRDSSVFPIEVEPVVGCFVSTQHIPFTRPVGEGEDDGDDEGAAADIGLFEYVSLLVVVPGGSEKDPCESAEALAEDAWPSLPRP